MAFLKHYGTPRHSGRYPWGSGEDPQRSMSIRQQIKEMRDKGMTEKEIATGLGMNTSQLRATISLEKAADWSANSAEATRLKEKGMSNVAIGERMGVNESTIRNWLNPAAQERMAATRATSDLLKKQVDEKMYLDVGAGAEIAMGISRTKLNTAIAELEQQGYKIHNQIQVEQLGTNKKTIVRVLTKEDVTARDIYNNFDKIQLVNAWTDDGGTSWKTVQDPVSLSSKRVMVRFGDDKPSGADMDGVIQLRRGVKDISLGENHYAQVRIAVDGTHYMKGMAMYVKDNKDLPDGIDIIYNSNKSSSVGKLGAMKKMNEKIDLEDGGSIYLDKSGKQKLNEFGATIRQKEYTDSKGNVKISPLNIVGFQGKPGSGEEGSWDSWSKTLSSQFLSKQTPTLARQQLDLAYKNSKADLDDILALNNPAVKTRLLDSFADDCDSKAVHLKAAAMPRQGSKVLLPITTLKENECYTTSYDNGEQLALIRYPHAGTFEIPVVTVNNKNREGIAVLGNAKDSIAVHPKTASKLSGADFDGDTVLTIPYSSAIKVKGTLKGLEDFDPKVAYPKVEGMKIISPRTKQNEMGKVSNLITDMTIKGASDSEIAAAVRHSMVVIDSEKHELNYTQSYIDNGIAALKVKYQGGTLSFPRGASTLISQSKSAIRVDNTRPVTKADAEDNPQFAGLVRKAGYSVDPATGQKVVVKTGESYVNSKGKVITKQTASTKMYETLMNTGDAINLSSGTVMEKVYADYANNMNSLGNAARKASVNTPSTTYSASAKKVYQTEVDSLNSKLLQATANKPLERQAQLLGNSIVNSKKQANPDLTAADIKKIKGQALEEARNRVGAKKQQVEITDKEWEAIQAGAISQSKLTQILNNTNLDTIRQLATPRSNKGITSSQEQRIKNYLSGGYSQAEIAEKVGVSVSTVNQFI